MGVVWTFLLSSILFSSLSPLLWETARYRLKYCLKGPLNPKQPTNQQNRSKQIKARFHVTVITQVNKSVVNFIVRRNVKGWVVPNANPFTKFDVKSGPRPDFTSQLELRLTSSRFILS